MNTIKIYDEDFLTHIRFGKVKEKMVSNKRYVQPTYPLSILPSFKKNHVFAISYPRSVIVKASYKSFSIKGLSEGKRESIKAGIKANSSDAINYFFRDDYKGFSQSEDNIDIDKAKALFSEEALFKLMISPEDDGILSEDFVKSTISNLEEKIGKKLKWIAVFHNDTGHKHAHILISRTSGKDLSWENPLKIDRKIISERLREDTIGKATRILGRKTPAEFKKSFYDSVLNQGNARIDYVISGNPRKDTNLFVTDQNVNYSTMNESRFKRLPIWQQELISQRLDYLSKNTNTGFEKNEQGVWICNNPTDWMDILSNLGKTSRFSGLNEEINIISKIRPLKNEITGIIEKHTLIDDNSGQTGIVFRTKDGNLHYVEKNLPYEELTDLDGKWIKVVPKQAQTKRYQVPEVRIAGISKEGGRSQ